MKSTGISETLLGRTREHRVSEYIPPEHHSLPNHLLPEGGSLELLRAGSLVIRCRNQR